MKTLRLCALLTLSLALSPAAAPQHQPHPPGLQDPSKNAPPLEPPMNSRPAPKIAQVQHDANELALLSQSVSSDINQATKGILPKDLGEKLKRIEKLSKKLRNELAL
jgi:hypothetical protein